ncbi:MAG: esterase-like activity of phytase family protein [Azospirillaceae bacterium]
MLFAPRSAASCANLLVGALLLAACGAAESDESASRAGDSSRSAEGAAPAQAAPVATARDLAYVAGLDLSGRAGVSGLSGSSVGADGRLVAVTDFGDVWSARPVFDETGALTDLRDTTSARLGGPPRQSGKGAADAEALARLPDGRAVVAFERRHRLQIYPAGADGLFDAPTVRALPPVMETLPGNSGIEALAALPDGRLLALAEAKAGQALTHPAFMGDPDGGDPDGGDPDGGDWLRLDYRAARGFSPADAATLPNGDVLVLERWYLPIFGFRARLAVIPAAELARAAAAASAADGSSADTVPTIEGRLLAELDPPVGMDNFEGLAVAPAPADAGPEGTVDLFLVSDDNRSDRQRPLLVQYRLGPGSATAALP